ncbi:acetylornithine deacetylase-like [Trypanosoma grayi]|uniref:acetylornithine deacetylase-like n=1 Tax=Trypanosoma grayi TaxID=71804 RepID=UPI0004F43E40|nr:acetylornithine deacetylase-like [Trypanosoma grayi]KEG06891.1 acetylornithine deacetylase-like [Trypanosoma grayi]
MSLTPEFLAMKRAKPIHFAWTYNEETDFAGVRQLVADTGIPVSNADGCIVGEPTGLELVIAHKGVQSAVVHLHGRAMHSSMSPQACNAIEHGATMVHFLRDLGREFRTRGPFAEGFPLPYTTVCPAMVQGGIAENTVPADCRITYEFRNIPGHGRGEVQQRIQKFVEATSQEMDKEVSGCHAEVCVSGWSDAFKGRSDTRVFAALQAASGEALEPVYAPYCTEAPEFETRGVGTVVWGPGGANEHEANEYVLLEHMQRAERILRKAVADLTGATRDSQL